MWTVCMFIDAEWTLSTLKGGFLAKPGRNIMEVLSDCTNSAAARLEAETLLLPH